MSTQVLLVLGARPKIGLSLADAFSAKGYKVALAARGFRDGVGEDGYLRLHIDLADPSGISSIFAKVGETFGIPSVVVYNAAYFIGHDASGPLASVSFEEVNQGFAINDISPLFGAKEAVEGF